MQLFTYLEDSIGVSTASVNEHREHEENEEFLPGILATRINLNFHYDKDHEDGETNLIMFGSGQFFNELPDGANTGEYSTSEDDRTDD